jgi:hypothetical protein
MTASFAFRQRSAGGHRLATRFTSATNEASTVAMALWRLSAADSDEKLELASDIDTVAADSLNALDLEWPIREAKC